MLYTGSIRDIDKTKYDEIWIIVRSLGDVPTGGNVYHVPQLSPSYNLFYDYRNWVKQGVWCKKQFDDVYKPRFLEEMKSDTAQQYLNLLRESCKTKDILICCFCSDESMCHRSIVKELVEGKNMSSERLFKFDKPYASNFEKDQVVTLVDRGTDFLVDNVALCDKESVMSSGHFVKTREENEFTNIIDTEFTKIIDALNEDLLFQEELAKKYNYRKLPQKLGEKVLDRFLDNIPKPLDKGDDVDIDSGKPGWRLEPINASLFTLNGTKICNKYNGIVIGHYGAFIEIDPSDMVMSNIICKEGEEYRINDPKYKNKVKYQWFTINDGSNVKLYYQQREVSYADYKVGMWYVSVHEVIAEYNFYLLIAGSRTFNDYELLKERCDFFLQNQKGTIHIVSGGAKGADTLAERYAKERGYELHVFPADWNTYGNSAGYIRNEEMHKFIAKASYKKGVVCFWDGQSKGTAHNFELSKKYNNPLRVVKF